MKENDKKRMFKRLDNMKMSIKYMLPLLIVFISVFAGMAIANGKIETNMSNVTNVTVDPNVTVVISTSIATPNVTVYPNATIVMPTQAATPIVTVTPIATAPTQTPVIISNVTESLPVSVTTSNVTVIPTITAQIPVVTQDIVERNTTIVYVPVTDKNVTQETNVVRETFDTPKQRRMPKEEPISTQTAVPISTTAGSTNGSNQNGFLGDISDKIIIGAILGFIGLFYEIIKIKYEHKQKAKTEKTNEDAQNKLLERLERRQEELLAKHGISGRQDTSLNRPEKQQEDIKDKNKNV